MTADPGRVVCRTSGTRPGAYKWAKNGRRGWCPSCGAWRALTPKYGKFKRHFVTRARATR